jgi:hypothetical protein
MPTAKGWKCAFDEPIVLANGRELVTLEDAGTYVTSTQLSPLWVKRRLQDANVRCRLFPQQPTSVETI